jgi:N-acetylglucosamine kinase-like BadF-type ATPase
LAIVLAVDLGRTSCRASVWRDQQDTPLAEASGEGSVGLSADDGATVAEQAILALVKPLQAEAGVSMVDSACVGAAGALSKNDAAHELARRLLASIPARQIAVTSDAITSHAGALAGQPGVVLAAGTGAVVIAIGADGQFHRVDGWGPWLGDEGSGAWLGRAGLQAAARAGDGRGPPTVLQDAATSRFGTLAALASTLAGAANPARVVASFAPDVVEAARTGDAVADGLLDAAAAALADSIRAGAHALPGLDPVPVVIVGGLTAPGSILLERLHAALERGDARLDLRAARGSSRDGARWLATHVGGIHEPWIVRASDTSHASTAGNGDQP